MTRKLYNDNGLQGWKTEHQAVTACKRNSPAAGATQGYIRLHAIRYMKCSNEY